MAFAPAAALSVRGAGPYGARTLRIENAGDGVATAITIAFVGERGAGALLAGALPLSLAPGEAVEVPLRRTRRDALFRVQLHWHTDGGEPGQFFGVLTAGV